MGGTLRPKEPPSIMCIRSTALAWRVQAGSRNPGTLSRRRIPRTPEQQPISSTHGASAKRTLRSRGGATAPAARPDIGQSARKRSSGSGGGGAAEPAAPLSCTVAAPVVSQTRATKALARHQSPATTSQRPQPPSPPLKRACGKAARYAAAAAAVPAWSAPGGSPTEHEVSASASPSRVTSSTSEPSQDAPGTPAVAPPSAAVAGGSGARPAVPPGLTSSACTIPTIPAAARQEENKTAPQEHKTPSSLRRWQTLPDTRTGSAADLRGVRPVPTSSVPLITSPPSSQRPGGRSGQKGSASHRSVSTYSLGSTWPSLSACTAARAAESARRAASTSATCETAEPVGKSLDSDRSDRGRGSRGPRWAIRQARRGAPGRGRFCAWQPTFRSSILPSCSCSPFSCAISTGATSARRRRMLGGASARPCSSRSCAACLCANLSRERAAQR
mmetsp:Transcript_21712/g.57949  ORF Transcript_21712/g.57949 Transcript_21712/m.57949 type:complete len:445 (-) Transcript_21712:127-1461(-)